MEPAFYEGNRVLTFNWAVLKKDDVIVFKKGQKFYLKRLTKIAKDLFYVSGDNKSSGSEFSPIEKSQIVGKVVLKY